MSESELQTALQNWIEQAQSSLGKLPEGMPPSHWVAKQFLIWWKEQAEEQLTDAQSASHALREELNRLDKEGSHGEALHELTHLQDALSDLSASLGFEPQAPNPNP